jgi:hypothetical protein
MNIDSSNFRDGTLTQVTIGYDWVNSLHFALINILKNGVTSTYCISGLSKYDLYDDFKCMAISQCKFIYDANGVYLSLDPCNELPHKDEQDCFCFWGDTISLK